jgi:hypothetical protein
MTLAALEINDQSLLIQSEDGAVHAEPGFARLTAEGIVTGDDARNLAWREPQHGYNQYWWHLNQLPLVARQRWARHHGDIAFAQLRHVWDAAGEPDHLVLLTPGSFSDEQLSLLLGMVGALPAECVAVIDSALAACPDARQPTLYVDMQLHQTVLTVCTPTDGHIEVTNQEVFPQLGLMQLQNSVARHISNLIIDSARYDPLHASEAEQSIHDRLPGWLAKLCWQPEVSAAIDSEQGKLPFILRQDAVRRLLSDRMASINTFCERHATHEVVLSHGSALLAGLSGLFADARVLAQTAVTEQALARVPKWLEPPQPLHRIRSVARDPGGETPAPVNGRVATHVLHGDRAIPLRSPVSIQVDGGALRLSPTLDDTATLAVVLRQHRLETLRLAPDTEARLPEHCTPGAVIEVAGHRLQLIEVTGG